MTTKNIDYKQLAKVWASVHFDEFSDADISYSRKNSKYCDLTDELSEKPVKTLSNKERALIERHTKFFIVDLMNAKNGLLKKFDNYYITGRKAEITQHIRNFGKLNVAYLEETGNTHQDLDSYLYFLRKVKNELQNEQYRRKVELEEK